MADRISKETRSKNMGTIRSFSILEEKIAIELLRRGISFRRNVKDQIRILNIAIKTYNAGIYIDSCFWRAFLVYGTCQKAIWIIG